MTFPYCTPDQAFAYGGSAGAGTDPVNEYAVMTDVVEVAARAIDTHCHQAFSRTTYVDAVYRARVDQDGTIICYPPVPVMDAPTAISYAVAPSTAWVAGSLAQVEVEERISGCVVRLLGAIPNASRTARTRVRLSYVGGYASAAALPADLAWCARAVSWYEFQRRTAPLDKTAMPAMGIVVFPSDWPKNVLERLARYVKGTPT